MFRYIVVQWDPDARAQNASAVAFEHSMRNRLRGWQTVFRAPGTSVFVSPSTNHRKKCHLLSDHRGVVLGSLYDRDASPGPAGGREISSAQTAAICATDGKSLISKFWGSYVAIILDPGSDRIQTVIRSPMGHLPCYYTSIEGASIYFSYVDDLVGLGVLRFAPNWEYMAAHVSLHQVFSEYTALDGVKMLLPGECRQVRGGIATNSLYWNPCKVAQEGIIEDRGRAVAELRRTMVNCAASCMADQTGVLHLLSGGVDSSITLFSLMQTPQRPPVICVNLYVEDSAADERAFARLAASRASCQLIEMNIGRDIRLSDALKIAPTVNPVWAFQSVTSSESIAALAVETGASSICSALGGDTLFMSGPTTPAAAEFLQRRGLHPHLLRIAQLTGRLDGVSALSVLNSAFRDGWFRRFDSRWLPHKEINRDVADKFANPEVVASAVTDQRYNNPWLRNADVVPVGKRWQIFYLPFDDFYYDPLVTEHYPEAIDITLTQPVAELCLKIPTYVHIDNGWNRGVAREAFSAELPHEILTRATKGNPMRWAARQIRSNVTFLRELLLDGELVKNRLVDRAKLEVALSDSFAKNAFDVSRLFDVLNAETWIQVWRGREHRAAA